WHKDPACRPTINQVIEHLNNVNNVSNKLEDEQINQRCVITSSELTEPSIITDDNLYNVDNLDDDINKLSLSSDFYQLTFNNSSESSNNNNLLSDQSQQKNNKFIIKNITNINEGILKDLIKEITNQLYFNSSKSRSQNEFDIFEEFKPDWLKIFIE